MMTYVESTFLDKRMERIQQEKLFLPDLRETNRIIYLSEKMNTSSVHTNPNDNGPNCSCSYWKK